MCLLKNDPTTLCVWLRIISLKRGSVGKPSVNSAKKVSHIRLEAG